MLDKFDLEDIVESIDNLTKAIKDLNEDLNLRLTSNEGTDVSDSLEQISNDINDYKKWKQGVQV
jgi:DNA-binding transcriptional regulator GbsR (MarR family)